MTKQTKRKLPKKGIIGFFLILLIPGALIFYQWIQPDVPKSSKTKETVVEVGGGKEATDKQEKEEPYKYHYKKRCRCCQSKCRIFCACVYRI
ncbi:hypothetical protein [Listeria riparia]|uniref:Uncharacterized protein n=1 Tax=Listeria riparia FSL S10-1204 TaxID=1265816 RepID=W7DCA6_9LIST|nr:hypothetical protein [Listeria riparia]EUJ42908.1 hypothetical protein PRIP_14672 [Listeria riparia FSL S10-1204]